MEAEGRLHVEKGLRSRWIRLRLDLKKKHVKMDEGLQRPKIEVDWLTQASEVGG